MAKNEAGFGTEGFVKVMSDEQLELLRLQISAYIVLSDELAQSHFNLTSQHHFHSGVNFGSTNYDPMLAYNGHKMGSRQRWSPSPDQLQMLECIFKEGNGTPSKLKIKTITEQLSKFGKISENNVYNWFQNRRARLKRKQPITETNDVVQELAQPQQMETRTHTKPEDGFAEIYHNATPSYDNSIFSILEDLSCWPESESFNELHQDLSSWPSIS